MEKEIREETKRKLKRDKNDNIFRYQEKDVNKKLIEILGKDFKKYREDFDKTQNYLQTKFIPDFPIELYIELLNRCNFDCVMCYRKHRLDEPRAELSLGIFKKIMDEAKENKLPSISINTGGDPFLYKDIKEVLRMVKEAGIQDIVLGTNAALLNDEMIEFIVKNKITRIKISLDAATSETYKKIRRGGTLKKTEKNIEKLIACKKKYNSFLPVIRLSFVVMDINSHEVQQFIDKWKDKADCVDLQRYIDISYVDKDAEIDQKVIKNSFCTGPFYSLTIWANGNITPFCSFHDLKFSFGNIHKDTLKSIWNGEKMKQIREQLASKRFNPVCQKCLYFRDKDLIDKISRD